MRTANGAASAVAELALPGPYDRAISASSSAWMASPNRPVDLAHAEGALERRALTRVVARVAGQHHVAERRAHQVLLRLDGQPGLRPQHLAAGAYPSPASRPAPAPTTPVPPRAAGRAHARGRPSSRSANSSAAPSGNRSRRAASTASSIYNLLQQCVHGTAESNKLDSLSRETPAARVPRRRPGRRLGKPAVQLEDRHPVREGPHGPCEVGVAGCLDEGSSSALLAPGASWSRCSGRSVISR